MVIEKSHFKGFNDDEVNDLMTTKRNELEMTNDGVAQ